MPLAGLLKTWTWLQWQLFLRQLHPHPFRWFDINQFSTKTERQKSEVVNRGGIGWLRPQLWYWFWSFSLIHGERRNATFHCSQSASCSSSNALTHKANQRIDFEKTSSSWSNSETFLRYEHKKNDRRRQKHIIKFNSRLKVKKSFSEESNQVFNATLTDWWWRNLRV